MTFLQPLMLWSFVALAPLAAFYFLKVRPRRKQTTAYFLWEKVWEEKRSNSLFQRLRDFLSFLLMLLACSAICLALARPEWKDQRKDLLILIDNSPSMAAWQGGESRLDRAKAVAADIVEGLNGTQRAAVATVAGKLVYHSHLTDNPRELLDAIESIAPSHQELRLDVLPGPKDERHQYSRDHRILFVSDACLGGGKLPDHVELVKVGDSLQNVGLVAADMAYLPGGVNRLGFYYQVASSYDKKREVDLMVARLDDNGREQIARVIPLDVKPGMNRPETFILDDASPGKWIARLDIKDALPDDDTAYLVAARPKPIRVKVQSKNRYFLENSVLAFSKGDHLLELVDKNPEIVLTNGVEADTERLILFHPTGKSCWWSDLGEEIEVGAPRVMIDNHPALRHVDAASIPFVGAKRLTPAPGAQILVADERGLPLVYKARHGSREAVIVNLDPVAAEFYFSAWFPVIVHSASIHLAGQDTTLAATYRPCDPVPIPGASEDKTSTWTTSLDEKTELKGKWAALDDRLGYSELSNDAGQWSVGSSLLAQSETLLGNDDAESTNEALSRGRSPTHWLTLLAIVVLVGESVLYHRRKVG
jgi:hypothetical protein